MTIKELEQNLIKKIRLLRKRKKELMKEKKYKELLENNKEFQKLKAFNKDIFQPLKYNYKGLQNIKKNGLKFKQNSKIVPKFYQDYRKCINIKQIDFYLEEIETLLLNYINKNKLIF